MRTPEERRAFVAWWMEVDLRLERLGYKSGMWLSDAHRVYATGTTAADAAAEIDRRRGRRGSSRLYNRSGVAHDERA
jgi:hypothetical protein